ncbi:ankyrin repeat and socs box protein, putative [Talaromyces stipitatus ATCC 10500]|uniref:Ankyrin repeat and socs box protein, putative n=1 Tax=Talaromyces stipitatus (strain ATCC 10500 / CBS 375.48 / QM 6759 / NRRL 1006) TaxID=441959 RepID=B8MP41_TALSN|nr:ankyrin repeat and socs box protein, putative [Talaromyces stipitatus ATCC 10500]EED14280.1 ankyrin repeat and socs box protein, putative [Talaromyces stipitatus ATCC 10500]
MDPLSVTASVIAVIQITSVVSTQCMQYVKSAKNTKSRILRLVQELGGLQIVLGTLEDLAKRSSHALQDQGNDPDEESYLLPTIHRLCQLEHVFEECLRKLKQLERDITPTSQANLTKKESFFRALQWPLKEAYMRNIMDDINHYISLFSLALTLDTTDNILAIHEKTFETHYMVKYLQSQKEEETRREHGEKIIKWLSAPDTSVDHTHALQMKTQNTGSWLTGDHQYQEWKQIAGSSFWLYGIAGSGKTVLSSTVIEDLISHGRQDLSTAIAYFYFKADDNDKSSSPGMLRSVLKQLFDRGKRTSTAFDQVIGNGDQQPSPEQLLFTLKDIVSEFRDVYIVLDALDECHDLQHLFDVFEEFEKWTEAHIHLLFTSRELKDIKEFVEGLTTEKFMIKLSAAIVKEDIRMYIRDRLRTDRNLKRWRNHPKVQEEIEQSLIEKSDGMFQWVRYQLISLVRCRNPRELRQALETMPKGLNDTYAQILSRISDDDYDVALRILSWLLFSVRPLSIEELAELAALDLNAESFNDIERLWDPAEVLNICPNLLTTIEEYDDEHGGEPRILVRLAHISIREYLLSTDILSGHAARYQIKEPYAHGLITDCCLMYMRLIKDAVSVAAESLPLAIYAVEYWLLHYEKVPETIAETHQLAFGFFSNRKEVYSRWITHILTMPISKFPIIHHDLIGPGPILPSPLEVVCHNSLLIVLKLMLENDEVEIKKEDVLKKALRATYLPTLLPRDKAGTTRLLLQYGADFNGDGKFATVLNAASYFGLDDFVQNELDRGSDVNAKGGYYVTALQAAIAGRHDRHVFEMLRHFWPTRVSRPGYILEQEEPTTIQILLKHGADPDICGGDVGSSLLASCLSGDIPCVKLLLAHGADPNYGIETLDVWKRSCLAAACKSADIRIVRLLMDKGARADSPMALDIDIVRFLLENGANPNNSDRYQDETPLQLACVNEQPAIVELLLKYAADFRVGGGRFGFPLQLTSATFGSIETLKVLIAKGADVNQRGGAFGTSLHAAAQFGDVEMVEYLISQGADIYAEGVMYKSVLRHALNYAYTDIFVLLLKEGADMETPGGRYGETLRQMLAAAPADRTELWFKTFETLDYLCAIVRKGETWQDFENIVVEDRGGQSGIFMQSGAGGSIPRPPRSCIACGLPQGSPVSGVLFMLYIAPLFRLGNPRNRFGYADDAANLAISTSLATNCVALSNLLQEALNWGAAEGITFAPDKYELLHFSRYKADQDPTRTPSVKDGSIIISENTKRLYLRWLGILFDKKLTFKWHVGEAASKALTVANALRSLGNTVRGVKPHLLQQAVSACVLHKAYYGAETWWPGRTHPGPSQTSN